MNCEGERTADFNCCPSNAEAIKHLEKQAAMLGAQLHPSNHRYHLWPDDVQEAICHCPACSGLSPADQALILEKAILHGLQRQDPQAKLSYLAYRRKNRHGAVLFKMAAETV